MDQSQTRVLVTGAGGFIGSHMVAYLKKKGYWVRAVDKEWPEMRKHMFGQADEVVTCDLRSDLLIYGMRIFDTVHWVFHYAADMGGVGYFFSDADGKASADNMRIDLNVLKSLQQGQSIFYASSFCAYPIKDQVLVGGKAKRAMKEEDFGPAPVEQIYGDEKRMMTILLEDARKSRGVDARVGIFSTIYGPYQETEDPKKSKFPTAICQKVSEAAEQVDMNFPAILAGKKDIVEPKIEIWGDGTQVRTFLYIDEAIEKMYRVMSADNYEGPVNIGSDEQVTIREMAEYVCELAGIVPSFQFNMEKPTGVMGKDTDNSKFNRLYGEVPQTSAREGFKKVYEWLTS